MANESLALKYRPKSFDDLIGQDVIATTVKNMIKTNRIPHAILLVGSRGTGKTTTARIIAKAINCLDSNVENRPCGRCANCLSIDSNRSSDVIEIDGASNRGVESIKKIRQDAQYASVFADYRVFIIDEVHMLSTEAFNALLKTLEEPPAHVIFIFATTDYDKLPDTIISRCIQLNFMRIKTSDIIRRLQHVCRLEGITASEEALAVIAKYVNGGMRDALSNLDKLRAYSSTINADDVREILGIVSENIYFDLVSSLLDNKPETAHKLISSLFEKGADIRLFLDEFIYFLLELSKLKLNIPVPDKSQDYLRRLKNLAERMNDNAISQLIVITKELINDVSLYAGAVAKALVELSIENMLKAVQGRYSTISEVQAITSSGALSTQAKRKVKHFVPPVMGAPTPVTEPEVQEISIDDVSSALEGL